MKTLGICNGDTASACLFKDGVLISAVSEERFSRIKMDNAFPEKSIKYIEMVKKQDLIKAKDLSICVLCLPIYPNSI